MSATPAESVQELRSLVRGYLRHIAELDPSGQYDYGCGCSMVNPEWYLGPIEAAIGAQPAASETA